MNLWLFVFNEIPEFLETVLNLHFGGHLSWPDQAWCNDLQQELQDAKDLLERHWKEHHVSRIEASRIFRAEESFFKFIALAGS